MRELSHCVAVRFESERDFLSHDLLALTVGESVTLTQKGEDGLDEDPDHAHRRGVDGRLRGVWIESACAE